MNLNHVSINKYKQKTPDNANEANYSDSKRLKIEKKSNKIQIIYNYQRYQWKANNKGDSSRYVCVYRDSKNCPASITVGKDNQILRCSDNHANHSPLTDADIKIYQTQQELKQKV